MQQQGRGVNFGFCVGWGHDHHRPCVGGRAFLGMVQSGVFFAGRLMNAVWKVSVLKDARCGEKDSPATRFACLGPSGFSLTNLAWRFFDGLCGTLAGWSILVPFCFFLFKFSFFLSENQRKQ